MAYEDYIPRGAGVPGAVSYVSPISDAATGVFLNALNEKNRQFDAQINAIAENQALLEQMKFREPDRAGMLVRAARIASDLDKEVQEKYSGDYGSLGARRAIASRIAQERGNFTQAQQAYEEEQPYRQMYMQLRASGQLAKKYNPATGKVEEVNPFQQALYDESGNRTATTLDYGDVRKRGDYDEYIKANIVDALNKTVRTAGRPKLLSTGLPYQYFTESGKIVGFDPKEAVGQVTDAMVDTFLKNNPTFAFEYGDNKESAKNYIKSVVAQNARKQTDMNFGNLTDTWSMAMAKAKASQTKDVRSPFMDAQKESGQSNEFIQKGLSFTKVLGATGQKSTIDAAKQVAADIAKSQQLLKISRDRGDMQAVATFQANIMAKKKQLADLNDLSREMADRKTNWLNDAAARITGGQVNLYKNLSEDAKRVIRQQMPKTDLQWGQMFDADKEGRYITMRNTLPIANDIQKTMAESMGNFDGTYFRIGGSKSASRNIYDVAEKMKVDPQALIAGVKSNQLKVKYVPSTGEYSIAIPSGLKSNKEGKLDFSDADATKPVHVYFSPNNNTRTLTGIQTFTESNRYSTKRAKQVFDTPNGPLTIEKVPGNNNYKLTQGNASQVMSKDMIDQFVTKLNEMELNKYATYTTNNFNQYNKIQDALE